MKDFPAYLFVILFSSCSSWSEKDSSKFMDQCEKTKWEKEICDCTLEKVKKQFSSFSEMAENENYMSSMLFECINEEKDN